MMWVPNGRQHGNVITTVSRESALMNRMVVSFDPNTSGSWPSANLAIFVPVEVWHPVTVTHMTYGGSTTGTGNYDAGVYSEDGGLIVSMGSTTPVNGYQETSVTNVQLFPGIYYLAFACSGTRSITKSNSVAVIEQKFCGCAQMAGAFPLPATASFASVANTLVPFIGVKVA